MSDRQSPASVEAEQRAEIASLVPLLRAQNEDLRRIAQLVKETDNVSKDVMREANSLGTGARNQVKTVEHATVMIGARRVYQLAVRRLRQMKAPVEQLLRSTEAPTPDAPSTATPRPSAAGSASAESASVESASVESASAESASVESASAESAAERSTAERSSAERSTAERSTEASKTERSPA